MRLTISHSVSHCVFYSGSAHFHSVSHRVQDVAMMSAKCPLNCSAVELWYKIMLEIRNQSDLTENHIKRKAAGYQRLSFNWLWLLMAVSKLSFADAKMLENIPQHLVRGDFAEDGAEVVEGLAEVFGEEVGSLAGGEGTFDVFEGFGRFHQGLVVP